MDNKRSEIMVVGHKNPDTDSICSAIAYAKLKCSILDSKFTAKRAGQINGETKFVLERFEVEEPELITNVGTQVSDIEIKRVEGVSGDITLKKAYEFMKEKNTVTLAITRNDNLEGLITIGDIATSDMDVYDSKILSKANTQYKSIVETLNGTMVSGDENAYFNKGKVLIAAASPELMENYVDDNDMVILSNRFESQFLAIEMKAGCIIVCVGAEVPPTIKRIAEEKGCTIITTPHDTFTVARLINQSMPIKYFMSTKNLTTFNTDDYTNEIKDIMSNKRHRYFPVLDENDKYCGMISKRSFIGMGKKKIILVDHNERSQAVDGIECAEILEIIDHHRLGNLETITPVFFRNQPVGCTATIVFQMYNENSVEIDKQIAGLLCAAIISDTLMFRSPTCTAIDRNAAETLAKVAEIDIENFSEEMFGAGSNLKDKTVDEIFYQDFKTFSTNGTTFGVGQISSMNSGELKNIKEKLAAHMESILGQGGTDMLFFMLTNILDESTELIYKGGKAKELLVISYGMEDDKGSVYLKGVVSRKKQFIPAIIAAIQQ